MNDQPARSAPPPEGDRAQRYPSSQRAERTSLANEASPTSPTSPPGKNGPVSPSPSGTPTGRKIPDWANWLILGILLVWNLLIFLPLTSQAVNLPYSDFVAQVRQGNVAQVQFSGQTISGHFTSAVTWPPADASSGNQQATAAASRSYSDFTTVMPPTNDPELLPLLQSKKVTITAQDTSSSPGILASLVFNFLPILLLFGLFYFSGRSMMKNGQNMLGFGASKARKYDPEHPSVTFADVAGEDEAKVELTEVVDFLKAPDRYRKLGARLPRGVLLVGPPGVGKTLMAKAVAGEAHVAFFSISGSEFVEMFVGVGASRVRDLFKQAKEAAPAIVFVDELDAVGRSRSTGTMGGSNDEREQTLNQLLVEMDGFDATTNVIVVAATNRPDVLDQALLRPGRFDRQVQLGYPDRAGREAILRIHTRELPLAADVDLPAIARAAAGFSGADLANLANEAALLAARANKTTVGMLEFEEAIDKILLGTKQADLAEPTERRTVAYHEGGHTLVALLTPGADPVQKVTIVPHGRALGVTEQRPDEDRRNYTRDYLLARLAVMLGGRAAEEVVFGQPTTGAENDLKQAASLARRMVGLWGMSDELGAVSYGVGETHQYLGQEVAAPKEYAESTAARIDAAVTHLVENAHASAVELLGTHRTTLDALASELVDTEIVTGSRLAEILAETTGRDVPPAESGIEAPSIPVLTTEVPVVA